MEKRAKPIATLLSTSWNKYAEQKEPTKFLPAPVEVKKNTLGTYSRFAALNKVSGDR